jgi:hypothetical protein
LVFQTLSPPGQIVKVPPRRAGSDHLRWGGRDRRARACPGLQQLTFVGLWPLAVTLMTLFVSETDDALVSGPRFTLLYIGVLFGTPTPTPT